MNKTAEELFQQNNDVTVGYNKQKGADAPNVTSLHMAGASVDWPCDHT